jgi:addiction module RelE/StbE family toxin
MEVRESKNFAKALQKLQARQQDAVRTAIKSFVADRQAPALRDHALKGKMKGLRAFSAGGDLRVVYREENDFLIIVLLDTGPHNQVYS